MTDGRKEGRTRGCVLDEQFCLFGWDVYKVEGKKILGRKVEVLSIELFVQFLKEGRNQGFNPSVRDVYQEVFSSLYSEPILKFE